MSDLQFAILCPVVGVAVLVILFLTAVVHDDGAGIPKTATVGCSR